MPKRISNSAHHKKGWRPLGPGVENENNFIIYCTKFVDKYQPEFRIDLEVITCIKI